MKEVKQKPTSNSKRPASPNQTTENSHGSPGSKYKQMMSQADVTSRCYKQQCHCPKTTPQKVELDSNNNY
jgi:hypothetical protein